MFLNRTHILRLGVPALTLLLGLFWYRRRRVVPAVPGGADEDEKPAKNYAPAEVCTKSPELEVVEVIEIEEEQEEEEVNHDPKVVVVGGTKPLPSPESHSDSGIITDESFTLNNSTTTPTTTIPPPAVSSSPSKKAVSPNLDIPFSEKTRSINSQAWYEEDEVLEEVTKLGSNPSNIAFSEQLPKRPNSKNKKRNQRNKKQQEAKIIKMTGKVVTPEPKKPPTPPVVEEIKQHQTSSAVSERDSANHSPVSGVLEGSVNDEARSEGSTDSGKGGSIKGVKTGGSNLYEFCIPVKYVGKLIGKNGCFLNSIKSSTGIHIQIKRHVTDQDIKLVTLIGSIDGINVGLDMIRRMFPEKHYPEVNLTAVQQIIKDLPEEVPLVPELIQLSLVEGVNNEVIVCNVLKPNHFFVQMPTHPTYMRLKMLDENMTEFYETVESPSAPHELWKGMILVAKWLDKWVRVSVENPNLDGSHSLVRLVDHGGYWTFSNSEMRKIHSDYLTLPFQAIEVFLANSQPKEGGWTQEAYEVVTQVCTGAVGQAQIEGYIDCSTFISLYFTLHEQRFISLADELIARNLAEPSSLQDTVPDKTIPIA